MTVNVKFADEISFKEVAEFILNPRNVLTSDQLNALGDALSIKRQQLIREVKRLVGVGSPVVFTSSKGFGDLEGTVTKMGRKNAHVRVPSLGQNWRVSISMLRAR